MAITLGQAELAFKTLNDNFAYASPLPVRRVKAVADALKVFFRTPREAKVQLQEWFVPPADGRTLNEMLMLMRKALQENLEDASMDRAENKTQKLKIKHIHYFKDLCIF